MAFRWGHGTVLLVVVASAGGCGGGGDGPGIVNAPVVTSVTISRANTDAIDVTGTVQLTANVQVANGAAQTVDWSSSAPNVATVNTSGLVTGVAPGQAVITATSTVNRNRTDNTTVTVNAPRVVGVTLNSGAKTIKVGENFAVTATVDTRGTIARTVNFSSSNATVATVSSTDGLTGTIVGIGAGQATITATSTADGTKNTTVPVTVTGSVRITSVNPSSVNIRTGTTTKLVPTVQADAGISSAVTYQTGNAAIATVAADGTVSGIAPGQTTVTIKAVADAAVTASVPVLVRSGVTLVSLTPDRDSLRRAYTRQYGLAVVAEPGVSTSVNLSSANAAIATIDASSRVTGVALGQTYVRAFSTVDPTVADSTLVTVVDPCVFHSPLPFGVSVPGTANDASCNGTDELFEYRFNAQTTIMTAGTAQFPANVVFIIDKTGGYYFSTTAGGSGSGWAVGTPGHYAADVIATNIAQRGNFSILTTTNPSLLPTCGIVATTGLTIQVPMNQCSFQPQGRPAGTYYSFGFGLLPFIPAGQQVTLTITTPAPIVPLVELRFGTGVFVQQIGTGQSLVATYTAPAGGGFAAFTMSSRDANQNGNVSVKIDGPQSLSYDAFVFGSGILTSTDRPQALRPPDHRLVPFVVQQPIRQ